MITMGDESWIYGYDPETKQRLSVEEPTVTKSKEGVADPELNKKHDHCFFQHEGDCSL
jgi:hypothetical protein